MNSKKEIALQFGTSLDNDNYTLFRATLAPHCKYNIGDKELKGPIDISNLYESNMKEGHQKFDELVWGNCRIEEVSENEFDVYFSDFLKHKGIEHNYKCKQRLTINDENLVTHIQHMELPCEREDLLKFYAKVGLK